VSTAPESAGVRGLVARAEQRGAALLRTLRRQPLCIWLEHTVEGFIRDDCMVRASSLTYATSLAIVPLLAVVLAILQGAGFAEYLRPFLLERVPMLDEQAVDGLLAYIDRANAQAIGGVGFAALLVTTWSMLGGIEGSLNRIFGVTTSRGYLKRAGDYLGMVVGGAVLIVLSITAQTVLEYPALLRAVLGDEVADVGASLGLKLMPWVLVWFAFGMLYAWMPNVRLRLREVLLGGLLGGTLFQLVQFGYLELQVGFARYHVIYGAIAQLPIFLVWIYFSWTVALVGGEAVAALRTLHAGVEEDLDPAGASGLALTALRAVYQAFEGGGPTPSASDLAVRLDLPTQRVRDALTPLVTAGILVEPEEGHGYLPANASRVVPLERVLDALRG